MFMTQGADLFRHKAVPSTELVLATLHSSAAIKVGAGLALASVVAGVVFLLGLSRFVALSTPSRTALHAAMTIATARSPRPQASG